MDDDLDISAISGQDDVESDGESLTAAEVLKKLEEAWQNEKLSPDLLENKSEIVTCVMELIAEMEENIKTAEKGSLKVSIHRMELDRVQYVLRSYLRCRLKKIEIHGPYFLEREKSRAENVPARLSPEEFAFAKELSASFESHLRTSALNHTPRMLQRINFASMIHQPNLDHYVFLQVNKSEDGVLLEEETDEQAADRVDLEENSQYLIRYKPIAELVQNGSVILL